MKRVTLTVGRFVRLVSMAGVLLMSQQVFAAGTDAGTTVANQAQVDYDVGGSAQTFILSDPAGNSVPGAGSGALTTDFVVDNRVDFTLVESGLLTHTEVTPGETDAFIQFTLTNTGNATQDWRLVFTSLTSADPDVDGLADTDVDMTNIRIFVDNDADGLEIGTDLDFVDELPEDGSVDIYIVADADVTLVDGDVANMDIEAITADSGGVGALGADTVDDVGNPDTAGVDVVFAEGGALGDGRLNAQDGFTVSSASLTITKTSTLISDPFNGTTNPKAIPGAVIEYVVTIENAGAQDATNVVIGDTLSADINLVSDVFGTDEFEIDNDGTITNCTEEADADVCVFAAGAVTVGVAAPAVGLDVLAGTTMTVTFRVTIL